MNLSPQAQQNLDTAVRNLMAVTGASDADAPAVAVSIAAFVMRDYADKLNGVS